VFIGEFVVGFFHGAIDASLHIVFQINGGRTIDANEMPDLRDHAADFGCVGAFDDPSDTVEAEPNERFALATISPDRTPNLLDAYGCLVHAKPPIQLGQAGTVPTAREQRRSACEMSRLPPRHVPQDKATPTSLAAA
jgi:hypothetical protein